MAILKPDQLRDGLRFARRNVIMTALKALIRRKPPSALRAPIAPAGAIVLGSAFTR